MSYSLPILALTESYYNTDMYNIHNTPDKGQLIQEGIQTTASRTATGTSVGGWVGAIVGAIAGITESGFKAGQAKKEGEALDEEAKRQLIAHIFSEDDTKKKKWLLPAILIGGVLVVAVVVIFIYVK
jgi:hypothetical protein